MKEVTLKQSLDINYMDILYEDDSVSIVSVLVCHEGINRNKSNLPHDVIVNALASLANKPIWGIPNDKYFRSDSTDFVEHARTDSDEENIMIFGTFPESGVNSAEFVEINNKTYLKVQAVLWKMYAPIAMSILENRDGNTKISIEISVRGTQDDDGILNVEEMKFLSATVLGAKIPEGIEGSSLNVVRYSLDTTIKESTQHFMKFSKLKQDNTYKIPDIVKQNAKQGLDCIDKLGHGGTSTGVAMANFIIKNDFMPLEKVAILKNYFEKHQCSNENVSGLLYGGNDAFLWSKNPNDFKESIVTNNLKSNDAEIKINSNDDNLKKEDDTMMDEKDKIENSEVEETIEESKVETVQEETEKEEESKNAETSDDIEGSDDSKLDESDKKDYKALYEALVTECDGLKNQLNAYVEKETKAADEEKMCNLLNKYAHCYSDNEMVTAKETMKKCSYEEFEKAVDEQVKSFALNCKNQQTISETSDTTEIPAVEEKKKFSISPFGLTQTYDFSKKSENGLDGIIENSGVKLK